MYKVVHETTQKEAARDRLCDQVTAQGNKCLRNFTGPKGFIPWQGLECYTISTKRGKLLISSVLPQYGSILTALNPKPTGNLTSEFEISLGPGDRKWTVLVEDDEYHRHICHNGKVIINVKQYACDVGLDYFRKHLPNRVITAYGNNGTRTLVRIADIDSSLVFEEIAEFLGERKDLKETLRG